jgi:hypothetical protein
MQKYYFSAPKKQSSEGNWTGRTEIAISEVEK